eukprot:s3366_g5.t1
MCASPRANHALRTVPPQAVAPYAHAHDAAIWETLEQGEDRRARVGARGPWLGRPSVRKGRWSPNSGWRAQQHPDDRRRLDLVVYGAAPLGGALCCDATLVSPLSRTGLPQPCAAAHDGAALRVAERRKRAAYPELNGGPQQLVVLGSEVGGRWNAGAHQLLRDLVRVRAQRVPPAVRSAASSEWARRWWAMLAVSVQQAVTSMHCPRVSLAGASPREPTVGARTGTSARPC